MLKPLFETAEDISGDDSGRIDAEYSREAGEAIDDLLPREVSDSDRGRHMALINLAAREINYKIVYYGCGSVREDHQHPIRPQAG